MTGLLVSVRDGDEARLAIEAGVDLLDVKEPLRGPLGCADAAAIEQVVEIARRQGRDLPISVALGELTGAAAQSTWPALQRIAFAKFGLAGCAATEDWAELWRTAVERLPPTVGRVAVVYADWQAARAPRPDEILQVAAQLNCRAALVDTFDKNGGSLVDCWSQAEIENFIRAAQSLGLLAVVGGGLQRANLRAIIELAPDYVAVRGAACRDGRSGPICREQVGQLVALVRAEQDRAQTSRAQKVHAKNCRTF